jgi:hypothetical protein
MKSYHQSSVVKDFGQWAVTKSGLECAKKYYHIPKVRLFDTTHPIEQHMAGKEWVEMPTFLEALAFARDYHRRVP